MVKWPISTILWNLNLSTSQVWGALCASSETLTQITRYVNMRIHQSPITATPLHLQLLRDLDPIPTFDYINNDGEVNATIGEMFEEQLNVTMEYQEQLASWIHRSLTSNRPAIRDGEEVKMANSNPNDPCYEAVKRALRFITPHIGTSYRTTSGGFLMSGLAHAALVAFKCGVPSMSVRFSMHFHVSCRTSASNPTKCTMSTGRTP